MGNRNKQPFYSGGNPSFPLSPSPYFSRAEDQRVAFDGGTDFDRVKNYQSIAFRPGFSLQASELNEIQEHFQMQLTLSIAMMNNWICSGGGFMWNGANTDSPGGVGGGTDNFSYPTSIGEGGGYNGTTPFHDSNYQVTAPGWRGTTPLYPYANPYVPQSGDINHGPGGRLVEAQLLSGGQGQTVRINFYSGWYLTEIRLPDTGGDMTGMSGLKHWVYLDTDTDSTYSQTYSVDVPVNTNSNFDTVVGLVVTSNYVGCEQTPDPINDQFDETLADNAAGFPNPASCGASRYSVNFSSAAASYPSGNSQDIYTEADRDQISLCVKINPLQRTVRYMNNQVLFAW